MKFNVQFDMYLWNVRNTVSFLNLPYNNNKKPKL